VFQIDVFQIDVFQIDVFQIDDERRGGEAGADPRMLPPRPLRLRATTIARIDETATS